MISINATLVLQVIHFLVLAFILNRLMFKPILKLIDEREQHVEKTKVQIDDMKNRVIQLTDQFRSEEIEARKNVTKERVQQNREGMFETEKLLEQSQEQAASIKTEADKKAQREIEKSSPLLPDEAGVLADRIIEKMIGRRSAVGSERQ